MPAEIFPVLHLYPLLLMIGAVGGFLSGLLGIGGGFLFVPALFFCLTAIGYGDYHAMHIAIGTSLAVIVATSLASAVGHARRRAIDGVLFRSMAPPMLLGVVIGAVTAVFLDTALLSAVFAFLTLLVAVYMAFGGTRPRPAEETPQPRTFRRAALGIGWISTVLGIGGAIVTVPLLVYGGTPVRRAVGTASALGLAVAFPAAICYGIMGLGVKGLPPWSAGFVNVLAAALIVPTSIVAAPFGVAASHSLPQSMLRRVFAFLLALVSLRMFYTLING